MSQENFEQIENYLTGNMSASEAQEFEAAMKKDNSLQLRVEEMRIQILAVEESALRESLESFHQEMENPADNDRTYASQMPAKRNFPTWAMAAAVAFLVGLGVYFSQQKTGHEKLFAMHFKPDPGLSTPMSSTTNYAFYRGMVDYKQGQYQEALNIWNPLISATDQNDTILYFIGVSHLASNRPDSAIFHLSKIDLNGKVFPNESAYYLGMSYLKLGKKKKAVEALEKSNNPTAIKVLADVKE